MWGPGHTGMSLPCTHGALVIMTLAVASLAENPSNEPQCLSEIAPTHLQLVPGGPSKFV